VWADVELVFQGGRVGVETHHFEPPVGQSEQCADGHIVDAGFQRPMQGKDTPVILSLDGVLGMDTTVHVRIVRFLENLVGADADVMHLPVFIYVQGCGIDIHPADFVMVFPGLVDGLNGFTHVIHIADRMFAVHRDQPLVTFPYQGQGFPFQFFPVQCGTLYGCITLAESAVGAVVDAMAGDIQRGEQHHPVAVHRPLDPVGGFKYCFPQFRILTVAQLCHIHCTQQLTGCGLGTGFLYDVTDFFRRRRCSVCQCLPDVVRKDEVGVRILFFPLAHSVQACFSPLCCSWVSHGSLPGGNFCWGDLDKSL